jgi:GAF domain-containing protein
LSTSNIGRVARSGVLHAIDDVSKDDSYRSCFSQVRSEIVVPIVASGKTIGVIDAESDSHPIHRRELRISQSKSSRCSNMPRLRITGPKLLSCSSCSTSASADH